MDACTLGCGLRPWPGAHGLPACFVNGPGAALPGPAGSRPGQGCGEWQVLTPGCTLAGRGASHVAQASLPARSGCVAPWLVSHEDWFCFPSCACL